MNIHVLLKSFCFSLFVTLMLLYMFSYIAGALQLNLSALFWISFTSALVGLVWNIVSFINGANYGVHTFFLHALPISFAFLPFVFRHEAIQWIHGSISMTIVAALHVVIALMGFITHWQLTYEELEFIE